MLGIILLFAAILGMLLFSEKRIYDAMGLVPTPGRLLLFAAGFVAAGALVLINVALETMICSVRWRFSAPTDYMAAAGIAWKFFIAVLTEELFFRGILLYALRQKARRQAALMVSAALFGTYHWFSYGMLGGPLVPMLYVFLVTALAGYTWAYAFVRSKTLLLPIGLHFGWNCISWLFAENSPYGGGPFRRVAALPLTELQNLFFSLLTGLLPGVLTFLMLYLHYAGKRDCRSVKNM